MKKLLICNGFPDEFASKLIAKHKDDISITVCKSKDEMLKDIEDAEMFITFVCNREMLEKAKKLKWIQVLSAGVDGLPLDLISKKGIMLTNGKGIHKNQMSEYAIWAMISLARNSSIIFRNQVNGKWDDSIPQNEINGSTAGILGLGSIGRETARKASALGMHVVGVKRTPQNVEYVEKVYGEDGMEEVFKKSDYIINILPHTPKTDKIIDRHYFSLMKKTACFINIGRGATVNEEDLIEALREKRIRSAVLDVFDEEPLPKSSPLWRMENVIITPHVCGESSKYLERSMKIIEHNLEAYLNGENMINVINLEKGY